MKRVTLLPFFAIIAAVSLAGCAMAQDGGRQATAPSLAKRAVEGRFDVAPPSVVVDPPGPLPTDLAGRLARWETDAAAAQQAFAAERGTAASLVVAAAGAAIASERWIVAQQSISRLESTRAPLANALADIDRLYIERRIDENIDGLPEIYALRDRLSDLVSGQNAVLEALTRQLPGR